MIYDLDLGDQIAELRKRGWTTLRTSEDQLFHQIRFLEHHVPVPLTREYLGGGCWRLETADHGRPA